MTTRVFFLFCLLTGYTLHLSAQTSLHGKLIDETSQPVSFANIVLLSLPDSTFIVGTVSDEQGAFSIKTISQDKIVCRISSVGYQTVYQESNGNADFGIISLKPDTQLLGEVVIKGNRPQTHIKGDAMVTGVEGTILEKAGTAGDLLSKIPNVSSEDGSVKVFGRGAAEIYINGRKMRNVSELDQLSSENIKSVEVISNPGVRYDASVKAVIRIVTKKVADEGFGLDNRAVARHRRTYGWSVFDQLNLHYNKKGLELSGMLYGGMFRGGNNQQMIIETHLEKLWRQKMDATYAKTKRKNLASNFSMNYRFNENHSIGVRYEIDRSMDTKSDWRYLSQVFCDGQIYENSNSRMLISDPSYQSDLNFYYNGNISNWNIDFNADGLWNKTKEGQHTTEIINENKERQVHTFNENRGKLYAAKLILSRPLCQGVLTMGSEYSHTNRTNLYLNPEGILSDDNSRIKEGTASGFTDYTRSFGKVNMQIGIRYEHVKFDYYENDKLINIQSRRFNNVFPSLNVTFPIRKAQIQLGYTEDIARPSYDNLRNNTYYVNRYTYQTGNPFLIPTLTRNLSLAVSYRWMNFSVGYSHVKDDIMQMSDKYLEEDPTISLLKMVNMPSYDRLAVSLTLAPTVGIWRPRFTAQIYKQWLLIDGADGTMSLNKPIGTLVWRNNISLPAGILVDIDAVYNTCGNTQNMYQQKSICNVSLALYKAFCQNRFTVQIQASNLLETADYDIVMYSGIRTMGDYITTFRQLSLTLRYKFNQAKSKYKGTGAGKSQKTRL